MIPVSSEFAQAFAEGDIYLGHRVTVEFGNNRFNDGQVITASSTKATTRGIDNSLQTPTVNFWQPGEVFNNKNRNTMKWLVCDRGATAQEFEDGTGYRAINIDDGEYERGWWSANKSDGSGNFATAEYVQAEFFMPDQVTPFYRRINRIVLYTFEGYANMKEVTVSYKDQTLGWTNVVANYTLLANTYIYSWDLPSDKIIQGLKVQVHKTFSVNDYARLSELQGLYVKDISDDVINIDVKESRQDYEGTVPIGINSANDFNMELDNTTGQYNIKNVDSTYYPYIGANNKFTIELGVDVNQGVGTPSYQYVKMGEFWSDEWSADSSSVTTRVTGRDFSKFLQDEISQLPRVWTNTNISTVLYDMMARSGKGPDEVNIDPAALRGFQILFVKDQSIWGFLQEVAFADQGVFGFDRYGEFYYHSYNRLNTTPYTSVQYNLSYDLNIETGSIQTELYVNKVIVRVSPVNTQNTGRRAIWEANSPTILGWTKLSGALNTTATTINCQVAPNQSLVNLTENGWPDKGYFWLPVLDSNGIATSGELIKYNSRTDSSFTNCERGYFGTPAASALDGAYIGEARIFDIEYDNAPALKVFYPFATAIDTLEILAGEGTPQANIIFWDYNPFNAKLIVGNTVNYLTWLSGPGTTIKDKFDGNENALDDVEIEFALLVAGEVSVEAAGRQATGIDNELNAENKDYMRRYGKNELQIDNTWIQSKNHAEDIANIIIDEYRVPREILNLEVLPYPPLELGDRVEVLNLPQLDIITTKYHIISASYQYDGALKGNLTLRKVKV